MYIDGVSKVVFFGFISTNNHIFYTFVVMRRLYILSKVTDQHFRMETDANHEEYLAVELLTYVELLKKDGMEEEAVVFTLYSSSLQVAMGIKP